jgi:hypothetical protein
MISDFLIPLSYVFHSRLSSFGLVELARLAAFMRIARRIGRDLKKL